MRALSAPIKTLIVITLLLGVSVGHVGAMRVFTLQTGGTPGTVISNGAEAIYQDALGSTSSTVSPTVAVTIQAVSSLTVTPDETTPSATVDQAERITRLFRICNTGNIADTYTISTADVNAPATLVSLYFDVDASGSVTPADSLITINGSTSPQVSPGACLGVLAVVDTNNSPAGSSLTIRITAQSNANGVNGIASDEGTIINAVGASTVLSSPFDASLPPVKTVNDATQATVTLGSVFNYSIVFRNSGSDAARGVVLTDNLDPQIEYVPGSLSIDGRTLTDANDGDEGTVQGQTVVVRPADIVPGQVVRVTFSARLAGATGGAMGVLNYASFTGQNIAATNSSSATVVVDPFGTVFSGRGGAGSPIAGATVAILRDQTEDYLPLPPAAGFPPNVQNDNPFVTDGLGHFNFVLLPEHLGTEALPARYFIKVTAPGFTTRMLEINAHATQGGLFTLHVRALDGQPLARAGGFDLVSEDVRIEDLVSLAFNIPMFETHGLEITKSADRPRAEIGDTVAYRVEIRNPTALSLSNVVVSDHLPVSFHYAAGTGRLRVGNGGEQEIEPQIAGSEIVFAIGEIGPGATARLLYRVRVGSNVQEGEQENVAIATGTFPNGETVQTAPARATVIVGRGVFSTRQIVVGRVFVDQNQNNKFDAGDTPVPGARLYLQTGQSVITDSAGLYNLPSLSDGTQVLSIDPITLPQGSRLVDGGTLAGRSWTRLLRTPIGGGALLHQNFILLTSETPETTAIAVAPVKNLSEEQNKSSNSENASAVTNLQSSTTEEFVTDETLEAVPPGQVKVLHPQPNATVMSAALELSARVALQWKVNLEVNGKTISDKSIGTIRKDQKNNITTYTYVGVDLRPGPNTIRVIPVSPEGVAGAPQELTVLGRGQARRLEIVSDKTQIEAGGRDFTKLRIRAFDEWGSPAADDQVAIETSAGDFRRADRQQAAKVKEDRPAAAKLSLGTAPPTLPQSSHQAPANPSEDNQGQLIILLVQGEAVVELTASGAPGEARLRAHMGQIEAQAKVRIVPESRPTILVGLAEMTVGQSIPEGNLRNEQGNYRNRLSFFYSGRIGEQNLLTLSYDSQRPLNRTATRDRIFQLDPLDRVYPLFGDSSTRYEAAQSNSKLYARLDRGRSYAMFGDFEADMEDLALTGYTRKLTGVKLHLENSEGDFVSVTGARPDTAFARDVFPVGGLGLVRLTHGEILIGSETVVLEVRDRRNPEIILSREPLSRSIDYNLNAVTGELFFLRYISAFDFNLNLTQVVVTYEHRASSLSSAIYTARGQKQFAGMGLQLGFAGVMQRQEDAGSFVLAGFDGEKTLPNRGKLRFAFAQSHGEIMGSGNFFAADDGTHNGNAFLLELKQPIDFYQAVVRARYSYSSEGFLNPFGATVTPGSRRGEVSLELKPLPSSLLRFGLTDEHNRTTSVNNNRLTFSARWEQLVNERIRFHLGYDHRSFDDALSARNIESNLVTAGAELKLTDRIQVAVKREQNFGEADPTYPNQTTLAATYQVNPWAKIFLTQRLASAPIMPIGDFSGSGFTSTGARRESALGIESKIGKHSALTGRYQLENGINGTDSFAVIGLQNRLPLTKEFSLDLGFERGFHLAGNGESFNSATVGLGWTPNRDFRSSVRYEFRDRIGGGQILALGAAGRISEGITALSRFQWARTAFDGRRNSTVEGTAALAVRPLTSDRAAVLFSYTHRSLVQDLANGSAQTRDQLDSLATDGYFQATDRLELFGRLALRFSANGQAELPFVSTFTYLTQGRAQYRLTRRIDWAAEVRRLTQPSSGTHRSIYGAEMGVWALPDLRVGFGYNFSATGEPQGISALPGRRGFYFTLTSKLSKLFDLFGTSNTGLADSDNAGGVIPTTQDKKQKKK